MARPPSRELLDFVKGELDNFFSYHSRSALLLPKNFRNQLYFDIKKFLNYLEVRNEKKGEKLTNSPWTISILATVLLENGSLQFSFAACCPG